jgi:transcription elongation factor Elf1
MAQKNVRYSDEHYSEANSCWVDRYWCPLCGTLLMPREYGNPTDNLLVLMCSTCGKNTQIELPALGYPMNEKSREFLLAMRRENPRLRDVPSLGGLG